MNVRSSTRSRRVSSFWLTAIAVALTFGMTAHKASAGTSISTDITSDTTWTPSGSPYVLDASIIHVAAGTTLTVDPGVTVEFGVGGLSQFVIQGTLSAMGTAANHIVFTSAEGALGNGAPGQYGGVLVWSGNDQSQFSYADFSYGGYGSGGYYAYGVLEVGNGSSVSIDHSTFEHNKYSGLTIGDSDLTNVSYSTFSDNGDGISILGTHPGPLNLTNSHVDNNAQDGLFFNFGNSSTVGSSIQSNDISHNGVAGIAIQEWDCSIPTSSWPHGEGNNIYGNGDPNAVFPADGAQLSTAWPACHALPVDWDNNYWGDAQLVVGPYALPCLACNDTQPGTIYSASPAYQSSGYLAYSYYDPSSVPPGPITTGSAKAFFDCLTGFGMWTWVYVYNSFYVHSFSNTPFAIP